MGATLNIIDIWLKPLKDNYEIRSEMYNKYMKDIFKQIPLTMIKSLSSKQKVQKLTTEISAGWYMEKSYMGLPPLKRSKLGKNHKIGRMKLKKVYEDNKLWNDRNFQLHWHKLEWVNQISKSKWNKSYSVSSNIFDLNKGDRTSHWVGHSALKEY